MPTLSFPSVVTKVDTTARFPLGYEVELPATALNTGSQVWVYVHAVAALANGLVAMRGDAVTIKSVILATVNVAARRIVGVAQHTIAINSYGFILKSGLGEVQASDAGTDQANQPLVTHAAGQADLMIGGEEQAVFAHSTENGSGAASLMTCWINCLG